MQEVLDKLKHQVIKLKIDIYLLRTGNQNAILEFQINIQKYYELLYPLAPTDLLLVMTTSSSVTRNIISYI